MDYKKKYEQALERCKKEFNFNNLAYSHEEIKQKLERVFPELNDDERIKKGIIEYLEQSQFGEEHYMIDDDVVRGYISWLEKQDEQKPTEIHITLNEAAKEYSGKESHPLNNAFIAGAKWQEEQNFTWSEEDERLLKLSLENLAELKNRFGEKYGRVGECICWLKSLKERMKGE